MSSLNKACRNYWVTGLHIAGLAWLDTKEERAGRVTYHMLSNLLFKYLEP